MRILGGFECLYVPADYHDHLYLTGRLARHLAGFSRMIDHEVIMRFDFKSWHSRFLVAAAAVHYCNTAHFCKLARGQSRDRDCVLIGTRGRLSCSGTSYQSKASRCWVPSSSYLEKALCAWSS